MERCPKCDGERLYRKGYAASGNPRYKCRDCKHEPTESTIPVSVQENWRPEWPKANGYVITAAQNATPAFTPFLANLLKLCEHRGYELIVVPIRYRNPNSRWTKRNQSDDWWDERLYPYMWGRRTKINDNLILLGDVKVVPTSSTPLAGYESMTGHRSGILGHPKLELHTVATPGHKLPKLMTTTGAITRKNYTDSSFGHKGDFHHTFGAAIVELHDETVFHVRQINAMRDGSFMDLDCRYSKDGVKEGIPVEALIMGDTHVDFVDPDVVRATFNGPQSIVGFLKPKYLVWHDLLDFYSRSKHTRHDPFITVAKYKANMLNVFDEIERACDFVSVMTPPGTKNILVPSNHPEFLLQWLRETDWRTDPENAEMYLETALAIVRSAKVGDSGAEFIDPFLFWAKRLMKCADRTAFLERDTSFKIKNIELAMHGDMGPNGSRGSARNLARIGAKSVIGHSHSPNIREGCYQVGTSSRLRLEYNRGPSSWMNTHCLIYSNSKRTLINIIDGVWRRE